MAVFILGDIIQITAMNSSAQMMMGRCIAGLGIGNLSVGVPMFQSESSPREIRGAVVASYQLMITIGILVANIVNYAVSGWESNSTSWRMVILTGMCLSLPLGIGIIYVPESPRWLAAGGDWESARTSLARLRGKQDDPSHAVVEADLDEMKRILEKEKQIGQGSWAECFSAASSTPKVLYRTLLGMAIHFLQQWTGINFFFYFGANIFSSTGIQDPLLTQIILGAVNVVMTLYGLYIVERFGRRQPLVIGAVWQAIWLLIFAMIGTLRDDSSSGTKQSGILMIISACMFIGSFAATWGPMAWVVVGETFPLRTRAKQASLATAGNWFGNCKSAVVPIFKCSWCPQVQMLLV